MEIEDIKDKRLRSKIKDQRSKIKDQRSKIKDQRSKIKDQRSKIKDQRSKIKDQRSKIKDQRSKIKDQRSKIKDQRSKIKGIRKVFPQFSIGACKDALEKKRCQLDDALQLLAHQEVLPTQQERIQLDNSDISHLLDLYFLAADWDIPVLINVVIDHLIDASFNHEISLNRSKDIYRHTEEGD